MEISTFSSFSFSPRMYVHSEVPTFIMCTSAYTYVRKLYECTCESLCKENDLTKRKVEVLSYRIRKITANLWVFLLDSGCANFSLFFFCLLKASERWFRNFKSNFLTIICFVIGMVRYVLPWFMERGSGKWTSSCAPLPLPLQNHLQPFYASVLGFFVTCFSWRVPLVMFSDCKATKAR